MRKYTQFDRDRDMKIVREAVGRLYEHFDTVQVMVSRHHPEGGTAHVNMGSGNMFARLGQCRDWLSREDEHCREFIRSQWREP